MRLVDLRSSTSAPPKLEVIPQASVAAEVLRMIGVLWSRDPADYDVGAARIAELRERAPEELSARIQQLITDEECKDFLILALLAASLPDPGGIEELLAVLDDDPAISWRLLVAQEAQQLEGVDPELGVALMEDDDDAFVAVRTWAEEQGGSARLRDLLATDPIAHGRELRDIVASFHELIWQDVEEESMAPIRRDVAHRKERLAGGADPVEVVVEATNGYEPPEDAGLRRLVLLPSYWMRPWLVIGHRGKGIEVISTVVADAFLVLPTEAPPPALLKLAKALSDESRLRLLRRMASGPISLTEATDALDVTKATAHHHLSILRQAGLVSMRGTGRATRYALRQNPADAAREALNEYCCRP